MDSMMQSPSTVYFPEAYHALCVRACIPLAELKEVLRSYWGEARELLSTQVQRAHVLGHDNDGPEPITL